MVGGHRGWRRLAHLHIEELLKGDLLLLGSLSVGLLLTLEHEPWREGVAVFAVVSSIRALPEPSVPPSLDRVDEVLAHNVGRRFGVALPRNNLL